MISLQCRFSNNIWQPRWSVTTGANAAGWIDMMVDCIYKPLLKDDGVGQRDVSIWQPSIRVVRLPNDAALKNHHILIKKWDKDVPQLENGLFGIISENMAMSLNQACRSLALSTWLLSFCFVHLLCLDFTVAEKEEWYTAFVNITYLDPVTSQMKTDKSECGRYGEHSPKRDARGFVFMPSHLQDRQACDSNTKFPLPHPNIPWIALISRGNCTYKEKIRHAATLNASAVVIFNVGFSNSNDTITMPHHGKTTQLSFLLHLLSNGILPIN